MKRSLKRPYLAAAAISMLGLSGTASAYEAGDVLLRAGPTWVLPNDDSSAVKPIPGSGVEVDDGISLGFSVTYLLTPQIGVELLAALPFEHDIKGEGSLDGVDIGSIKHLPPTVTLQWYPDLGVDWVQPYVGAGINYTTFFDEDADGELEAIVGKTDISLDDSWGYALELGADWRVSDRWYVNTSLWYVDIATDATLKTAGSGTLKTDVDIDPLVVMVGVGMRF
jgi:outer membrane protein